MSLVDTLMNSLRTRYNSAVDKNERRRSQYGALNTFQRQTSGPRSVVTPELASLIPDSFAKEITIPVLDAQDVTIGNVRSCTIPDSENQSNLTTLTFFTVAFGFTMTPMQHRVNQISYQTDFDVKMEKYLLKLAAHLDSLCIDKLNADKNQVWNPETTNIYAQVGNALQVPQSEHNDYYNQLSSIMETMDFYDGQYDVVANTMHKPIISRLMAQGAGNDENENFQFGPYNWNLTNRVTNRAGVHSTLYALPQGTVGIVNRNDPDARAGSSVGTHKLWGTTNLPLVNMNVGTFYVEDCADRSALHAGTAGLTRTKLEGYEFSTDIALMSTYNSNRATRYNPIVKSELWASDTAPV